MLWMVEARGSLHDSEWRQGFCAQVASVIGVKARLLCTVNKKMLENVRKRKLVWEGSRSGTACCSSGTPLDASSWPSSLFLSHAVNRYRALGLRWYWTWEKHRGTSPSEPWSHCSWRLWSTSTRSVNHYLSLLATSTHCFICCDYHVIVMWLSCMYGINV